MNKHVTKINDASSLNVRWVKSSHSGGESNSCVEFGQLANGDVAVRNSRDPQGPALVYTPGEMRAFLAGVKDGEFDWLVN